jgi:Flp pilus assembly protein TadG
LASKRIYRPIRAFLGDRRGISTIEFTLVAMLFFMFILGITDFSRAMWEWNMASKATHAGVRLAVVTDMVAENWQMYSGLGDSVCGGICGAGGKITTAPASLTNPTICTNTGCNGNGAAAFYDPVAFNTILAEVQSVFGRVQPQNLEIQYRFFGGFSGNPVGPDVDALVTVRLTNMDFLFLSLGFIGLDTMSMPDFAATLTGEDHCELGPCP